MTQKSPQIPPVFLLAGVLLVIAFALQLIRFVLVQPATRPVTHSAAPLMPQPAKTQPAVRQPVQPEVSERKIPEGNVFQTLHMRYPNYEARERLKAQERAALQAPPPPLQPLPVGRYNVLLGQAVPGAQQLVVFTDFACGFCMQQTADVLGQAAASGVAHQVVFKFLPQVKGQLDGGIFALMAEQAGAFEAFLDKTAQQGRGVQELITLLEQAGVPLEQQRTLMAQQMRSFIRGVNEDIELAQELGLSAPPVFYLQGRRLGTPEYDLTGIATYMQRLARGGDF